MAGESLDNIYLAFVVGIIFHFILDAIPHFDNLLENDKWTWKQWFFTGSDLLITISLIIFINSQISWPSPFLWGAFGGLLPNIFDNVPFWNKKFRNSYVGAKLHAFH